MSNHQIPQIEQKHVQPTEVISQYKGRIFQHYKGQYYQCLGFSINSDNDQLEVVYTPMYEMEDMKNEAEWSNICHCSKAKFNSNVEHNGVTMKRFTRVNI